MSNIWLGVIVNGKLKCNKPETDILSNSWLVVIVGD